MKKFGFIVLALSLSAIALPAAAGVVSDTKTAAVQQQQPPPLPDEAAAEYGVYYAEKDQAKKYDLAKKFVEKYNGKIDEYWLKGPKRFITNYEVTLAYNKCFEADKAFFGGPNEANLNTFLAACDEYAQKAIDKPERYFSTRMALGTGFGVLAGFYKDTARATGYAQKAMPLVSDTSVPKGWEAKQWEAFRTESAGRLTQYMGLYLLRQGTPDPAGAADFLTKAAANKTSGAYKDPNTYLLRAEAVTAEYTRLNNEYNALSDDDKRGDKGKAALDKIYPTVSKLANDYARVVALTEGKPEYKAIYDDAKTQTESFWKFLKNKVEGVEALYANFKADPSVPDMEIKPEESTTPKTAPTAPTPADKTPATKKPVTKKPAQ